MAMSAERNLLMDTALHPKQLHTTCCIVGGGPAGMMAGYLLARAGVEVVVLEKHADFLRDFRGDTIHPSTLDLMWELGLLEKLLERPHQEVQQLRGVVGDTEVTIADFSRLPTHCKFIALMPQWDFLDFLANEARHFPSFRIEMQAEAVDLIEEAGAIAGVRRGRFVRSPRVFGNFQAAKRVGIVDHLLGDFILANLVDVGNGPRLNGCADSIWRIARIPNGDEIDIETIRPRVGASSARRYKARNGKNYQP
jgi:FAD binding domain